METLLDRTLIFTKGAGKTDSLKFRIAGETFVHLLNPKQGILPHDMVHYVVEKCFPFEGFIQLVFKGHEPGKTMDVLHNVAPRLQAEYSETSWMTESLVESLQATLWSNSPSFDDFKYAYEKACEARGIEPAEICVADYQACRDLIGDLSRRWSSVEIGTALELSF
jgi:hypothetical protein